MPVHRARARLRSLPVTAIAAAPPLVRAWRAVLWTVETPFRLVVTSLLITTAGLGLDAFATLPQQYLLSVAAWGVLAVMLVPANHAIRAQTLVVVVVATCAEVFGSILVGVYGYRHGNLPLFVPAGHGIVYLTGLRLSQTRWPHAHPRAFTGIAAVLAGGWALAGLTVLPRLDVAGAVGVAVLLLFLLRSRYRAIYAGVFIAVMFLEIYGTWIGTWRWEETIPGLGIPDGNPPSGAAAGYVMFDIAALWLAPLLLGAWASLRATEPGGSSPGGPDDDGGGRGRA